MPAGQTPYTILVYAHNDLVDKVQPGDRIQVTGMRCTLQYCTRLNRNVHGSHYLDKTTPYMPVCQYRVGLVHVSVTSNLTD